MLTKGEAVGGSIYQAKVALRGIRPPIWRRVQVPSLAGAGRRAGLCGVRRVHRLSHIIAPCHADDQEAFSSGRVDPC